MPAAEQSPSPLAPVVGGALLGHLVIRADKRFGRGRACTVLSSAAWNNRYGSICCEELCNFYLVLNVDFISVIMHRTCVELWFLFIWVFYGYRYIFLNFKESKLLLKAWLSIVLNNQYKNMVLEASLFCVP